MDPRRLALLTALTSLAVLTGCGDDPTPVPAAPTASAAASGAAGSPGLTPPPPSGAPPTAAPSTGPSTGPSTAAGPSSPRSGRPFPGDTRPDTAEAQGEPLTVTAVRVARQPGFDRVVLELTGGTGRPGWRVQYDDSPTRDGSGDAVDLDGSTALVVIVTGVGYPFDTGEDEVTDDPDLPSDLEVVTDLKLGATFEGQFEAFVGVDGRRPFTVRRLSGPARVVVDISHG